MQRYRVPVVTDTTPEETRDALNRADIPTRGPIPTGRPGGPPPPESIANRVIAYLHAETEEAAATRVREVVGEDCAVGPAEPVSEYTSAPKLLR